MISVEEAAARVVATFAPTGAETIPISEADGRVLAGDAIARANQPPEAVSSMDGYAVRAADTTAPGNTLQVIGEAPAGHPYRGALTSGQAVRIFTGGVVPKGADAIIIQEDATREGDRVTFATAATVGRHIRAAGLDFKADSVIVPKGRRLSPRDLALLAAADLPQVAVRRRPKIVLAATGDELSKPGEPRKPGGIVASSGYGLSALISRWGGTAIDLGILPDTIEAVAGIAESTKGADLVVTIGGASVGDHDLVQQALGPKGFALDFWKIAMRPGKPLIFGKLGATPLFGLPGNPVSTLVCATLFLEPAIAAMLGAASTTAVRAARLAIPMAANDQRQDYVRARIRVEGGERWVEPFALQDSSMMSVFAQADCLIVRPPVAPAAPKGTQVDVIMLS